MCSGNSTINSKTFSSPLCFLGLMGVFIGEPILTLSSPFLCLIGKKILSWDFALLKLASSFHVVFLKMFGE
jgi:hypothetical protein